MSRLETNMDESTRHISRSAIKRPCTSHLDKRIYYYWSWEAFSKRTECWTGPCFCFSSLTSGFILWKQALQWLILILKWNSIHSQAWHWILIYITNEPLSEISLGDICQIKNVLYGLQCRIFTTHIYYGSFLSAEARASCSSMVLEGGSDYLPDSGRVFESLT